MIGNLLTFPIGIWLAFSAIFSVPAGAGGNTNLAVCGAAITVLSALARFEGAMTWQTVTNTVLGLVLLVYGALRLYIGDLGFGPFWLGLLGGSAVSIGALWSILYRKPIESSAGEFVAAGR